MSIPILYFCSFMLTLLFHVLIHETGHLYFGKKNGYELIEFKIGFIVVNELGFQLTKVFRDSYCLMLPPKEEENKSIPFVLYNIGGVIFNAALTAISILALVLIPANVSLFIRVPLFFSLFNGLIVIVSNLIPYNLNGESCDGANLVCCLMKDYKQYHFNQLYINCSLAKGIRYQDMPTKWFDVNKVRNNPLIHSILISRYYRFLDMLQLEKARKELEKIGVYSVNSKGLQATLFLEHLFLDMLDSKSIQDINETLNSRKYKRAIKNCGNYLLVDRIKFTYAHLSKNDNIDKDISKYTIGLVEGEFGDVKMEYDLILYVNKFSENMF